MKIFYLRAGEGFLEIVFVGCVSCLFVLNLLIFFFLAAMNSLKTSIFFFFYMITLMKTFYLRTVECFLEIVFVGLCEVFVCLEFVKLFFFFFLAPKLIGPAQGCEFFKNVDFFRCDPP